MLLKLLTTDKLIIMNGKGLVQTNTNKGNVLGIWADLGP